VASSPNSLDRKTIDVEIPISKVNALHLVGKMFNYFVPAAPQLSLLLIPSETLDPPGLTSIAPLV
jgi:hypothetical protein